jgi:hypothetical protein
VSIREKEISRYPIADSSILSGDKTFQNRKSDVSSSPVIHKNIDY